MRTGEHATLLKLGFVLAALFYITQIVRTSTSVPARAAPDERHHFALVVFFVEHDLLDFDREHVRTDRHDFNHLSHPPFYYYLVARAARIVFPALGPGFFSAERGTFLAQSESWVHVFRLSSIILFTPIYLFGVYLCLRTLISSRICTVPASLALFLLWSFLSSRLMAAAVLSSDAMSMAAWPWLLYVVLCAFQGPTNPRWYYFSAVFAVTLAMMAKATLFPLIAIVAVVGLYGATAAPLGSPSWRRLQFVLAEIGAARIGAGLAVVSIPLASIVVDYARYGSIAPPFYLVYPDVDPEAKFFNQTLLQHPLGFWRLSFEIIDRMWRSTIGVYGHKFNYTTGTGPLTGLLYLGCVAAVGAAAAIGCVLSRGDGRQAWLVIATTSGAYVLFVALFLVQMYQMHVSRGHFAAQGRYTIGYFEMSLLSMVALGERLIYHGRALSRRPRAAISTGVYLTIGALTVLLIRPWGLTGYSLFAARRDGTAAALLARRVIPASELTFQGSAVRVDEVGTRAGSRGGYSDAGAIMLRSSARSFEVAVSAPARPREAATYPADPAKRCGELLVSTNRGVRITGSPADVISIDPYEFALVPATGTTKIHVVLNENVIERVRNSSWPPTSVFVYGWLPRAC